MGPHAVPDLGTAVVGLAILVLAFLAYALHARSVALRGADRDPARQWFGFAQRIQWTGVAFWLVWFPCVHVLGAERLIEPMLASLDPALRMLAAAAVGLASPMAMTVALAAIAYPVSRRMQRTAATRQGAMAAAFWQQAAVFIPLLAIGLVAAVALSGHVRQALLLAGGAVIAVPITARMQMRSAGAEPHAVTSGELRERVFALAAAAGVRLQQLYVMTIDSSRIANAFAVRRGVVILTDHLLASLSKREVDAALAHELSHLRARHPLWLVVGLLGGGLAWPLAGDSASPAFVFPIALAASLLIHATLSRRFERAADAGAVRLVRDPEALISALGALNRLNLVPLEWSRWRGSVLTHPSTARRARAIAGAAGIPPERVAALLATGLEDPARYAVPALRAGERKAFSTVFKSQASTRIMGWMLAAQTLAPAASIGVIQLLGLDPGRGIEWLLGLAASLGAALLAYDRVSVSPLRSLRRQLAERAVRNGLDPERSGARFVGLAPSTRRRVYEYFFDWDAGFLALVGDRLVYCGEEARFALGRAQVTDVRLGAGAPTWIRSTRVEVHWRHEDAGGVLSFRPADPARLSAVGAEARALLAEIEAWRSRPAAETGTLSAPRDLGPPAMREVTATPVRAAAHPRTLPITFVLTSLAAGLACVLLGLPLAPQRPGWFDVASAAFLVHLAQRLPFWCYREPAEPDERRLAEAA